MDQAVKKGMEYEVWLKEKKSDDRKKAREKKRRLARRVKSQTRRESQRNKCIYEELFECYSVQCL